MSCDRIYNSLLEVSKRFAINRDKEETTPEDNPQKPYIPVLAAEHTTEPKFIRFCFSSTQAC